MKISTISLSSLMWQVHPVLDSQALLCYEKPPLADRSSTPPPPQSCYPLAPNICVEAGRIQFIRQETEGAAPPQPPPSDALVGAGGRVTVTRGLQTDVGEDEADFREVQVGGDTGTPFSFTKISLGYEMLRKF